MAIAHSACESASFLVFYALHHFHSITPPPGSRQGSPSHVMP
jgi:hypothetical protein